MSIVLQTCDTAAKQAKVRSNKTMKRVLASALLLAACTPLVNACSGDHQKREVAVGLFKNGEFYEFACGPAGCNFDEFLNRLRFRTETLSSTKRVFACFAEAVSSAKNAYTGVFLVDGGKISPQFVFFGASIQTISKRRNGYKVLLGSELIEAGVWEEHFYVWNGKAYVYKKRP